MHQSDSRMRALIGLWILAGLMVVGVNGTMLLSLLDEPLAGYSSGVRNADRAFRQYRMRLTAEAEKMTSGMERLTSWFDTRGCGRRTTAIAKNAHFAVVGQKDGPSESGAADVEWHYDQSIKRWVDQAAGPIGRAHLCPRGATRRFHREADCPWGRLFGPG
jgi:hypothetical protein